MAFHARYMTHGKFRTDPAHYPPEHQAYLEEDVIKARAWAEAVGPETTKLIHALLEGPYPLRYLRRSMSILQLSRKYSKAELEHAAATANRFDNKKLVYIEGVIKQGGCGRAADKKGGEPIARSFNPHLRGIDKIVH